MRAFLALALFALFSPTLRAADLFAQENVVAWCIVPFDAKKRSPEDRAAMLKSLGFKKYAYDWRAEHLPTFERELAALKAQGIELTAVWFPRLDKDGIFLLDTLRKHGLKTQLWVKLTNPPADLDQAAKVKFAIEKLRPIVEVAAKDRHTVRLYNHGGWGGEPQNQLAVLALLRAPNVGIVYNLHHGHDHLDRFSEILKTTRPHLLAVNLNGMVKGGDRIDKKILPLGQGDLDLSLLKALADSGYTGPIGILGHTSHDAAERLQDNLDGLRWLVPQLRGQPTAPRPMPRTR